MKATGQRHCCALDGGRPVGAKAAATSVSIPRAVRGILGIVKALSPGALLVLLPKCPLCIVGYAAAAGIGLSISTAENLRSLAFFSCLGLLAFFAARQIYLFRRFLPGRSS